MGWYERQVLPRIIDKMLGTKKLGPLRERAMEGLHGEIVEIGFGSGTNVPWYPSTVQSVLAIDPSQVARSLARKRLDASSVPVRFVELCDGRIDLADASVDAALSTFTLCTVPDELETLREIGRVVKPNGRLSFLEHGRSDNARIARRQHHLDGLQQRIGGGCHLTRCHTDLLREAGFTDLDVTTFTIAGPKVASFLYAGSARVPDPDRPH